MKERLTLTRLSFLTSKKEWKRFLIVLGVVLIGLKVLEQNVHLVVNNSDSLPFRTFIQFRNWEPKKESYSIVDSDWYGGRLIKKIIGVEGDPIAYNDEGDLLVNGENLGKPQQMTKAGKTLTSIQEQVIPPGKVFVYAPHERSFDSRYEELGLVSVTALQGVVYPLR